MKRTKKLTFSAMMAALSAAFMLLSYFPYLTYAIPAAASLFIMAVVIEIDKKWAILSFIASAVIVFLTAEIESKLMFLGFLGYYPILKATVERIRKPVLEWIIKILAFNIAVVVIYFAFSGVLNVSARDFGVLGEYGIYIILILGNAVFAVYDIALSRLAMAYMYVMHPKVKKILK